MARVMRERAKSLFVHYMKLVFEKAGLRWDHDNRSEIEEIVDLIFGPIEELQDAVSELERKVGRMQ